MLDLSSSFVIPLFLSYPYRLSIEGLRDDETSLISFIYTYFVVGYWLYLAKSVSDFRLYSTLSYTSEISDIFLDVWSFSYSLSDVLRVGYWGY